MSATRTSPHAVARRSNGWAQWRSSRGSGPDASVGDRTATAAVGLACSIAGILAALLERGTVTAVFAGLLTLSITPGCALACWLPIKGRLSRLLGVITASLTWTVLLTATLAWMRVTNLAVLLAFTAGIGGLGSVSFLILHAAGYAKDGGHTPRSWEENDPGNETEFRQTFSDQNPDNVHQSYFMTVFLGAALSLAVVLYVLSVIRAHGRDVGSYGLLPLLGAPFFVSVVLAVVVLVVALCFIKAAWPIAGLSICLILVQFNGTPMMLTSTPISSWTYKHFGVVDYIVHGGALNDSRDIYQQWPGFFSSAAALVRLSGRTSLSYSNWAQLLFTALCTLVVFAIGKHIAQGRRTLPYIAAVLFATVNWEGQQYYSPQTLAFFLAILFQYFVITTLEPARVRSFFPRLPGVEAPTVDTRGQFDRNRASEIAWTVAMICIFAAMITTHELTPYVVFVGLLGMWVIGVFRHPFLLLVLALMLIGYPLLRWSAIDANQLFNGFSFSNAAGSQGLKPPSTQQALGSIFAKTISLPFWFATAVCTLWQWRRILSIAPLIAFAIAPFFFVLVTNYDGEAIYRVFLFSSPWCALIIAHRIGSMTRWAGLREVVFGGWALFAALGSAQAQDFGMFPMLEVPAQEIAASQYFLDHAPGTSTLVLAIANFPSRLNGRYVDHNIVQSQNDPSLDQSPEFQKNSLDNFSPQQIAQAVDSLAGGDGYLVVAPSMYQDIEYYNTITHQALSSLVPRLEASRYWQVWYQNSRTVILKPWPQGRPVKQSISPGSQG